MTKICIIRNWLWPNLKQQTPNNSGTWEDFHFTENQDDPSDYYIILNNLTTEQTFPCSKDKIFRIIQEPPTEFFKPWHIHKEYASKTFTCDPDSKGEEYIPSHPMVPWHINRDYDFLASASIPEKAKLISWITSTKAILGGHKKRMEFLDSISGKIPELDLVGTEIHHITKPEARKQNSEEQAQLGFKIVEDKWAGLAPYKYSLAIENFSGPNYWTEKLADCFLAFTLPIYYGCTNLEDYFPPLSFIRIDIDKPEEAIKIIRETISTHSWEKRIDAIKKARELVLNKYQLFPAMAGYIKEIEKNNSSSPYNIIYSQPSLEPGKFNSGQLPLSVVVCTYNRAEMLPNCLQSLANQDLKKENYEILIIDNNSTDHTRQVAQEFIKSNPNAKYFFQPTQGLSHARNLGVKEATGEYIAFIDDDSIADTQWLSHALTIINEKSPDIFGGAVYPLFPDGKPEWLKEEYAIRGHMGETRFIDSGFIIGTNIFFKKSLLNEYGGFDPRFGMNGEKIGYHEETQLVLRAFQEKKKVFFSGELIVKDVLPDYKKSILFYIYSKYQAGIDGVELWKPSYSEAQHTHVFELIKTAMEEWNTALMGRDKTKYPYPENYLLDNNLLKKFFEIGMIVESYFKTHQTSDKIKPVTAPVIDDPNEKDLAPKEQDMNKLAEQIVAGGNTLKFIFNLLKHKFKLRRETPDFSKGIR